MFDHAMLRRPRPRSRSSLGTSVRIVGLLLLGCSAASATALLYPGRNTSADVARPVANLEKAQAPAAGSPKQPVVVAAIETTTTKAAPVITPPAPAGPPGVRQIPLSGGVDPTPAAAPKPLQGRVQPAGMDAAAAAPVQAVPAKEAAPALAVTAKASTECLPEGLRSVLDEVQKRFGPVTLVSTTHLHTDNHSPGSVRHKMHAACKAVDFKVAGDAKAVTAYLRSRPEVSGVQVYKNNRVIHVDASERKLARTDR